MYKLAPELAQRNHPTVLNLLHFIFSLSVYSASSYIRPYAREGEEAPLVSDLHSPRQINPRLLDMVKNLLELEGAKGILYEQPLDGEIIAT